MDGSVQVLWGCGIILYVRNNIQRSIHKHHLIFGTSFRIILKGEHWMYWPLFLSLYYIGVSWALNIIYHCQYLYIFVSHGIDNWWCCIGIYGGNNICIRCISSSSLKWLSHHFRCDQFHICAIIDGLRHSTRHVYDVAWMDLEAEWPTA
jgi:hypothetical protein